MDVEGQAVVLVAAAGEGDRVPSGDQDGAVSLVNGSLVRLAVRPEPGLTMNTSSS